MASHRAANVEMAAAWDGPSGASWSRDWKQHDRALRDHHEGLMAAARVGVDEKVLDVGCGNGQTTRSSARAAAGGWAHGVDLSKAMLERARLLAHEESLTNVTFEQADAQVHAFTSAAHTLALSRFGVMFFADPAEAFTNIARALHPDGRLAMVTWQPLDRNEWTLVLRRTLAVGRDLSSPAPDQPGPFRLSDPDDVRSILSMAGFEDVQVDPFEAPFRAGDRAVDALEFMRDSGTARTLLEDLDDSQRGRGLSALHAALEAHQTHEGVMLGSAAWIITARRST